MREDVRAQREEVRGQKEDVRVFSRRWTRLRIIISYVIMIQGSCVLQCAVSVLP